MEIIATVITLIGVILNIKKNRFCFLVWFITTILWSVIQFRAGIYGMVLCQIAFGVANIWGWIEWREDKRMPFSTSLRRKIGYNSKKWKMD